MAPDRDGEKRRAAERSLAFIENGMTIGLGTGTTAAHMIRLLGERIEAGLRVRAVPTSTATRRAAERARIPLVNLDECPALDLAIDGADEVDPTFDLIKGGGGALLHEKIVAVASRRLVVVVDESKMVDRLGRFPLPVEVSRFGWRVVAERIAALGTRPALRTGEGGIPAVTDEGNYILDCGFGTIGDTGALARALDAIPGVIEHGLFVAMADTVIVGQARGVAVLHRRP